MTHKLLFLLMMPVFFFSCGPVKSVVETDNSEEREVRIEYRDRFIRDSVFWRDTVMIKQQNDTIYQSVVKWRERWRSDTIRVEKIDTVTVYSERIKEVEVNKLTFLQRTKLKIFNMVILSVIIFVLWTMLRKKK